MSSSPDVKASSRLLSEPMKRYMMAPMLRPAAKIALVRDELHVLLRDVLGEGERAGADRPRVEGCAQLLDRPLADDVAAMVVGDQAQEARQPDVSG